MLILGLPITGLVAPWSKLCPNLGSLTRVYELSLVRMASYLLSDVRRVQYDMIHRASCDPAIPYFQLHSISSPFPVTDRNAFSKLFDKV